MAQRLVRAKRRIREARIPFVVPEQSRMPERLAPVLEAVYGAYAIDFGIVAGPEPRESLADESLHLATTLASLLPDESEAAALAALIAYSLARRDARMVDGEFVPLEEQDRSRWDADLIAIGERWLRAAHVAGRHGRFEIEASIQAVHCGRAPIDGSNAQTLLALHAALLMVAPTLGARVAYAAAVGRANGPIAGLAALDAIDDDAVQRFQPAWATRAHLLAEAAMLDEAAKAYDRAIALTTDPAARRWLERRRAGVVEQRS